jgi:N-acetylneuraminic acid mutarotase
MRLESPTGAYASGSVHLFGGITPSWTYPEYVLEYDISAGEWSTGTELPYPAMFIRCATLDDHRIMIAGGENDTSLAVAACYIFDASTGTFTEAEPLPEGRSGGSMVHMDGRVYYMGGWSNTSVVQDDIFAYDVAADNWSLAGNLPQALSGIASVASSDGLVYMIGGGTSSGWYSATVDKALAWNPVDGGSWSFRAWNGR